MNRALLATALLLLTLPAATAQAPGGTHIEQLTITLIDTTQGIQVFERYSLVVDDANAFATNSTFYLYVDERATVPTFQTVRGGIQEPVPAQDVGPGTTPLSGFRDYAINLTSTTETTLGLVVRYDIPSDTYRYILPDTVAGTAVVYAHPGNGQQADAVSGFATGFIVAEDRVHAVPRSKAAQHRLEVAFVDATTAAPAPTRELNTWLFLGLALLVGFLVGVTAHKRGWIGAKRAKSLQKGGGLESRQLLEARRRTLMAALKELEVGHQSKEIPDDAYAPLKEEYKSQAVRVLRSLEEKREPEKK